MALTVNSNIQAMNAYRNLNKTQASLSSSLEKLSSGLRINRAADDAAGLAISEGFKAQIGGIQQASKNAQDGVSLVQTADGALSETQTILQRLRTLAVSSANGSQSTTSRTAINSEATALKAELTRISQTSNFNGVNLLDGTLKTAASFQIGYRADNAASGIAGNVIAVGVDSGSAVSVQTAASATRAALLDGTSITTTAANFDLTQGAASATHAAVGPTTSSVVQAKYDFSGTGTFSVNVTLDGTAQTVTVNASVSTAANLVTALNTAASTAFSGANKLVFAVSGSGISVSGGSAANLGSSDTVSINGFSIAQVTGTPATDYGFTVSSASGAAAITSNQSFSASVSLDGTTYNISLASSNYATSANFITALNAAASVATSGGNKIVFASSGNQISVSAGASATNSAGASSSVAVTAMSFGASNSAVSYGFTVGAATGTAAVLAATLSNAGAFDAIGLGVGSLDLSTQASATVAITAIDAAITNVSNARATLGALQNRFQYTVDNLDTTSENLSSAESRVTDTDMASEMVNYTRASILSQAGTSMLSQAKNLPQSILDLLKS